MESWVTLVIKALLRLFVLKTKQGRKAVNMAIVSKPKCIICGEEVEGIGELDIPYHVECVLKLFQKRNNGGGSGTGHITEDIHSQEGIGTEQTAS